MPHDIFRDVTRPPAGLGSQAPSTVPLSILAHAAVVVILVIVPIVATDDKLQIPVDCRDGGAARTAGTAAAADGEIGHLCGAERYSGSHLCADDGSGVDHGRNRSAPGAGSAEHRQR